MGSIGASWSRAAAPPRPNGFGANGARNVGDVGDTADAVAAPPAPGPTSVIGGIPPRRCDRIGDAHHLAIEDDFGTMVGARVARCLSRSAPRPEQLDAIAEFFRARRSSGAIEEILRHNTALCATLVRMRGGKNGKFCAVSWPSTSNEDWASAVTEALRSFRPLGERHPSCSIRVRM